MPETRNQRRSRRRRETRDERLEQRYKRAIDQKAKATCTIVFSNWYYNSIQGYAYNHPKFASGARLTTSTVTHNNREFADENLWVIRTQNSTYHVVHMSDAWEKVGAGNPLKRLVYKLWPKMIFLAMFQRIMYNPMNSGYMMALQDFQTRI
tara:strand:+ start:9614 stop:10066 length:453 start_codon:yes stop_codon:yes gene_type:complete